MKKRKKTDNKMTKRKKTDNKMAKWKQQTPDVHFCA
jgi:hypothetical protein